MIFGMAKTHKNWPKTNAQRQQGGFAILIVLVAVVIMMMLYFIDMRAIFRTEPRSKRPEDRPERPWLEEHRIVGKNILIKMPKPPKPQLDSDFKLKAVVTYDDSDRGELTLDFTIDGEVSGQWYCSYSHESRYYTFEADLAGNIDVEKTWIDSQTNAADPSKLYFITRGKYTQTVYNQGSGVRSSEQGTAYVTGFLGSDYSASGLIVITTDQIWSAKYEWQTEF